MSTATAEQSVERPRGVLDIVQEAFDLYVKAFINFWIPFLILGVITGVFSSLLTIVNYSFTQEIRSGQSTNILAYLVNLMISVLTLTGLSFIGGAIATGMVVTMVRPVMTGQVTSLSEAFQNAQRVFLQLILASLLYGLIVSVGFLLLIIPGFIFLTWYYVFAICIVLEDESVTGSLSRSKNLVSGDGWHVFRLIIVSLLVVGIIQAFLTSIVGFILPFDFVYTGANEASYIVGSFISSFVSSIVAPLTGIMTTLLYYDLKARKQLTPDRPMYGSAPSGYAPYPSNTAQFCPNCGSALPNDPSASHCPSCGNRYR